MVRGAIIKIIGFPKSNTCDKHLVRVSRRRCSTSARVKSLNVEAAAVPVKVQKLFVANAAAAKERESEEVEREALCCCQ